MQSDDPMLPPPYESAPWKEARGAGWAAAWGRLPSDGTAAAAAAASARCYARRQDPLSVKNTILVERRAEVLSSGPNLLACLACKGS